MFPFTRRSCMNPYGAFWAFGNIYHLSQILQIQRAAHTLLRRYIRSGESGGRGTSHGQSLYRLVKSSCFTAFVNGYSCRLLCDTYGKACFAEKTSQAVFTRRGARGCRKSDALKDGKEDKKKNKISAEKRREMMRQKERKNDGDDN